MAFPALGLSKIVWAVDVLLASDLPEFRLDAVAPATWHRIGALDAFAAPFDARRVRGPHAARLPRERRLRPCMTTTARTSATPIPLEALEGGQLRCPKHGWTFDIATGACTANGRPPAQALPEQDREGGAVRGVVRPGRDAVIVACAISSRLALRRVAKGRARVQHVVAHDAHARLEP